MPQILRSRALAAATLAVVVVGCLVACGGAPPTAKPTRESPSSTPAETPEPSPVAPPVRVAPVASSDPNDLSVVVNKLRPLTPADYAPADVVEVAVPYANQPFLRREAADATVAMFAAFEAQTGLKMQAQSAYRSYSTQVSVYAGWVASKGQAGADLTSARPGHSEHQTGLAIDISALPAVCTLQACFADTPQGQWLAANAVTYGFVLRYPAGGTPVTGYEFEPWHYRYVGVAMAADYAATGATTLEQYFGLPAAPTYAP
ncbi:M15 family metallopeptidase [Conyzicola nivalis]|uniref:M15 family metallopeptidase n=1 Tax=Conyzicola nivalis TaxID=1477021 RepID=UPI003398477D